MLSFEIAGGVDAVRRFIEAVEIFSLAESWVALKASFPIPPR